MKQIDGEQLQRLIDGHGAALVLYARQWCRVPEDALQEALIDLLRQAPPPDRPVAWLFHTVRLRAMNLARGERRRQEHQCRAGRQREAWFLMEPDAGFDTEELAGMLQQLPSLEREVVVARIWGELSFEEIGQLTSISSSAAHRRYRKALALLGEMISREEDSDGNHEQEQRVADRSGT